MENDFFDLYEKLSNFELEMSHKSDEGWKLNINDKPSDSITYAVSVQHCDRKKVFAMAYHKLTDYLLETKGGY